MSDSNNISSENDFNKDGFIERVDLDNIDKVQGLDDRPNMGKKPGESGMTAEELKRRFDNLPLEIGRKLNALLGALSDPQCGGKFIALELDDSTDDQQAKLGNSLRSFIDSFFNGNMAARFLVQLAAAETKESLLAILQDLKSKVSNHAETIELASDNISANAEAIKANAGNIELNSGKISANAKNIKFNSDNISANAEVIKANSEDISILKGDAKTEGSVRHEIAVALSAILDNDNENLDSLEELVTWIETHIPEAAEIIERLAALSEESEKMKTELLGKQDGLSISSTPGSGKVPKYTSDGTLRTYSPKHDFDCVNKRYLAQVIPEQGASSLELDELKKRVENLEDELLIVIKDTEVKDSKVVPENIAKYAVINKLGGVSDELIDVAFADTSCKLSSNVGNLYLGELKEGSYRLCIKNSIPNLGEWIIESDNGQIAFSEVFENECPKEFDFNVYDNHIGNNIWFTAHSSSWVRSPEDGGVDFNSNDEITSPMLYEIKEGKIHKSVHNLCIADNHYDLGEEHNESASQVLDLNLGSLAAGVYQLSVYGGVYNMAGGYIQGANIVGPDSFANATFDGDIVFGVTDTCEVTASLFSPYIMRTEDEREESDCWYGEITGVMLVKIAETCTDSSELAGVIPITDLEYTPHILRPKKITAIESYGAQLFDESQITKFYDSNNNASPKFGEIVKNAAGDYDYIRVTRTGYSGLCYWGDFSMHLTPGEYTVSSDVYLNSNIGFDTTVTVGLRSKAKKGGGTSTEFNYPDDYDKWIRISSKVNIPIEDDYYCRGECSGHAENYQNLDVRFKNIKVAREGVDTNFKPFSADPIDAIEIPEWVRSLPGYGIGKSESECNYIDFDRKVFVDEYEIVNNEIQKRSKSIETDISEHLVNYEDFMFLEVEHGGTLVFYDGNKPETHAFSEVSYMRKI